MSPSLAVESEQLLGVSKLAVDSLVKMSCITNM